jgi:hypothetical protein
MVAAFAAAMREAFAELQALRRRTGKPARKA